MIQDSNSKSLIMRISRGGRGTLKIRRSWCAKTDCEPPGPAAINNKDSKSAPRQEPKFKLLSMRSPGGDDTLMNSGARMLHNWKEKDGRSSCAM